MRISVPPSVPCPPVLCPPCSPCSLWLPSLFQNRSRDTSFRPMTKYGAQKAAVDAHSTRGPETILDSTEPLPRDSSESFALFVSFAVIPSSHPSSPGRTFKFTHPTRRMSSLKSPAPAAHPCHHPPEGILQRPAIERYKVTAETQTKSPTSL